MSSTENNNRAASHDFQTALRLLEERLRSLEDSEDMESMKMQIWQKHTHYTEI